MAAGQRYTKEQFEKAIPGTGGLINAIARKVGCDYHTAKKRIEASPDLTALHIAEREKIGDMAEMNIIKSIESGNVDDSWRWLKTQRRKEFGDNVDVTSKGESISQRVDDERFDRAIQSLARAIGAALPDADDGQAGALDTAKR